MLRSVAFALNAHENLEMTKEISTDDEPDIWWKSLSALDITRHDSIDVAIRAAGSIDVGGAFEATPMAHISKVFGTGVAKCLAGQEGRYGLKASFVARRGLITELARPAAITITLMTTADDG